MAETFERLGIQLELESEIKGNPVQVLANLKKSLEDIAKVLKDIDLSKLGKINTGATKKGLDDTLKSATALKEALNSVASIKPVSNGFSNSISDINKVTAAAKKLNEELKKASTFGPKISPVPLPNTDAFLKATQQKKLATGQVEYFQPKASPVGANDLPEIMKVIQRAWKQGYAMEDYSLQNFGKVGGKVFGIDADAFTPKAQASVTSLKELQQMATKFIQSEAGIKNVAEAISTVGIRANLSAQSLQKVGATWKEFLVANKEIALAKTGNDWEKAQRLMSDFYQNWKREAKEAAVEANKANAVVTATKGLSIQQMGVKQSQATDLNEAKDYTALWYKGKDADGAAKAYLKNIEDVKNQELKILTERGQQTLAILRNTETAEKATRESAIKGWREYISALSAQGYKAVEGGSGYVKKSAVTDAGQAQTLAVNEQMSRVMSDLYKKSLDTKLSINQVSEAFRQAGVNVKELDGTDLKKINSGLVQMKANIQATENGFKQVNTVAVTFGDVINSMTKRLVEFYSIRTVLFAVGNQLRTSVATLLDFNQTLRDTMAVTGASPARFKELEQAALSMAKNTKFSAVEVAEAMKTIAQAGVADKDLTDVTRVATLLATGSGSTIEQSSKILTTGMNVWKIEAKDSIQIANVMAAALNASKLEIGELGTAFNYLANQSALSGRSLTETTAIIGVLRNQGIQASTIGTSMSQMMKTLESPTPRFDALLKKLKIDPKDIKPTEKSMADIVQVFEQAAQRLGNNSIAIGDIFKALETRVGRGFATLIQAGSESLRQMEDSIKNTNSAAVAWAESMKGARSQLNILKSELTETISVFGKNFESMLGATDIIRNIIVGFRDAGVQAVILTAAIGALGLVFLRLAPAAQILTGIAAGLLAITNSIGGSNRGLAKEFDNLNTSTANSARDFKNVTEELYGFSRALKDVKKDANGNLIINDQYKKTLADLILKYPDLKNHLGDEKKLQAAITGELAKQNAQRRESVRLQIGQYNTVAGKVNNDVLAFRETYKDTFKKELPKGATADVLEKELNAAMKNRGLSDRMTNGGYIRDFKLKRQLSKIKENDAALQNALMLQRGELGVEAQVDPLTGVPTKLTVRDDVVAAVNKATKKTDKRVLDDEASRGTSSGKSQYSERLQQQIEASQEYIKLQQALAKDEARTSDEIEQFKINAQLEAKNLAELRLQKGLEDIKNKYSSASAKKKGVNQADVQIEINKLKEALEYQTQRELIETTKSFDNLTKERTKLAAKYQADISKAEAEAIKKEQDALQKSLEQVLKSKTLDYTTIMDAYYKELESIRKEFDAKRVAAEQEANKKLADELDKLKIPTGSKEALGLSILAKDALNKTIAGINADELKAKVGVAGQLSNAGVPAISAAEKSADIALRTRQAELDIMKQLSASGTEVNRLEVEGIKAQIDAQEKKNTAYRTFIELQDKIKAAGIAAIEKDTKTYDTPAKQAQAKVIFERQHVEALSQANDKLRDGVELTKQLNFAKAEKADESFIGNLGIGIRNSMRELDNFKARTQELGKSITDTFVNGLGTTLSNTFSTAFFPDQGKINEIQTKINELRTQKADLEGNIGTIERNTDKTPEEIKNLNDYKTKLDEVNNALRQQEEAVRKQKDAWSTFAEGLKGVMKTILQELQNYIIKLIAVWVVQKLVGLTFNAFGGDSALAGAEQGSFSETALLGMKNFSGAGMAQGGIVKGYAEGGLVNGVSGGLIPETMGVKGKDSVPIMAMPNEYIIPSEIVRSWGAGHFEKYRNGTFKKMAEGGLVGSGTAGPTTEKSSNSKDLTLQIINIADPSSIPPQPVDAQQVINIVSFNANAKKEMYRVIKNAVAN